MKGPFEFTLEELQKLDSEQYARCQQSVFDQMKDQLHLAFSEGFSHAVVVDGKVVEKSIANELSPGSMAMIEQQYPGKAYFVFNSPKLIHDLEHPDKPVDDWLYRSTMLLPKEPSTMEDYIKAIIAQSDRKGWSKDKSWLKLSVYKEVGELIQALEHGKSDEEVGGEVSDIHYFLWQLVKAERPNIHLDNSLILKMQDNEVKKKKTIDGDGNIVRK